MLSSFHFVVRVLAGHKRAFAYANLIECALVLGVNVLECASVVLITEHCYVRGHAEHLAQFVYQRLDWVVFGHHEALGLAALWVGRVVKCDRDGRFVRALVVGVAEAQSSR